jgi:hypothetical protein
MAVAQDNSRMLGCSGRQLMERDFGHLRVMRMTGKLPSRGIAASSGC